MTDRMIKVLTGGLIIGIIGYTIEAPKEFYIGMSMGIIIEGIRELIVQHR